MKGTLYIVATPIGNLKDITFHAVEILKQADYIFAEDTRVAKKLLSHYQITTSLNSYHQHSNLAKKNKIKEMLKQGANIAIITDAGTPGISDPGNELIDYLHTDVSVVPIPGPSAVTTALSVCGFDTARYIFVGFFPRRKRDKLISWATKGKSALVFFESSKRIIKTIKYLSDKLGDNHKIFVARELTKLHETHYRGTIKEVLEGLTNEPKLKGEITVVCAPTRSRT